MSTTQKIIKYLAIAFAISLIVAIFTGIYQVIGSIGSFETNGGGLNIDKYADNSNILSIDIATSKLTIKEGETLKVETNNKYITSKKDNNKLSIKEKSHNLFKNLNKNETNVFIPKNITFDKVYISNGAGTINIENLVTKDLELEIGAGKLEIDKITSLNTTDIDGGAGEVEINNANLNDLDLDIGVGKFTLNTILTGKNEIDAGVGELNINLLDKKENYSIYAEAGIGNININGETTKDNINYGTGRNKIDIDGGVGSINIMFKEEFQQN